MGEDVFCCAMRRRYLTGVVAEDEAAPRPEDLVDFVIDFGEEGIEIVEGESSAVPYTQPVIAFRFCPFCGQSLEGQTLRIPEDPKE